MLVEHQAGVGSEIRDEEYANAGAWLRGSDQIWAEAELALKVAHTAGCVPQLTGSDS
jgi:alanine dehydrogenase